MMQKTRLTGHGTESQVATENLTWGFALFSGGLAQFIAGTFEFRRNNVFAFTAFISYGAFWMSLAIASILSTVAGYYDTKKTEWVPLFNLDAQAAQALLCFWGCFTSVLLVCTFKINVTMSALFLALAIAFFLLSAGVKDETTEMVGGWFGLVAAALAFWLASLELINDVVGGGEEILCPGHWGKGSSHDRHHGAFHAAGRIHGQLQHSALREGGFSEKDKGQMIHPTTVVPRTMATQTSEEPFRA